jgi:hypothetical protein
MNFRLWLEDNPYTKQRKTWPINTTSPERLAALPDDKLWFHGSLHKFDQFKIAGIKRRVSHWNNFLGIHFASDPALANNIATYYRPSKGYTYDVELDVTNPIDVGRERNMDVEALKLAYDQGLVTEKDIKNVMNKNAYIKDGGSWGDRDMSMEEFFKYIELKAAIVLNNLGAKRSVVAKNYKKHLKSKGYDSIIYKPVYSGEGFEPCIIVFDPEKIRINKVKEV